MLEEGLKRIVKRFTVTVEFELEYGYVAASFVKPLHLPDGEIDPVALGDYEEFIVNALEIFDAYGFEVIEETESSSHSCYFALVKKEDLEKADYKYILFFRLSNHDLSNQRKAVQKKYFANHAQELKEPKSKKMQRWKFKRITVNDETYDSYEDALNALEEKVKGC